MATADIAAPGETGELSFREAFHQYVVRRSRPSFATKFTQARLKRAGVEANVHIGDAEFSSNEAVERRVDTSARLLPDALHRRLNAAYGRVSAYVADPRFSRPHPSIPGVHLVPASRADAFLGGWAAVKERFDADLEEFFAVYDASYVEPVRAYWSRELPPDLFKVAIQPHIPPLAEVRRKMGVRLIPCVIDYQEARDAADAITDLAAGIRDDLEGALEAAREKLRSAKVLTADSFNDLRKALTTARAFADVLDPDLLARVRALDDRVADAAAAAADAPALGATATSLIRDRASLLSKAIRDVADAVQTGDGDAVLQRFALSPRKIR